MTCVGCPRRCRVDRPCRIATPSSGVCRWRGTTRDAARTAEPHRSHTTHVAHVRQGHPEPLARGGELERGQSARALDIRVVPLIEPGRGYPTGPRGRANMFYSTDEAGAYLHHISLSYDDLADGTFFVHGHVHGGYDAAIRTMDWTAASGVAPQTYFGTTRLGATRVPRSGGMPSALGVPVKDATRKPRGGNYRDGEFYASRLSIRRRPRSGSPRPLKLWTRTRAAPTSTTRYLCQDCPRRTSSGTIARLRVRIPGNTAARGYGACSLREIQRWVPTILH